MSVLSSTALIAGALIHFAATWAKNYIIYWDMYQTIPFIQPQSTLWSDKSSVSIISHRTPAISNMATQSVLIDAVIFSLIATSSA